MVVTIPTPLADQTIESLTAVMWAKNPWPTWKEAVKAIFGSSGINPGGLIHSGVQNCSQVLCGLGYKSLEELAANHLYLPIFKPFLDASTYRESQQLMIEGQTTKLVSLSRVQAVSTEIQFCQDCAEYEWRRHGHAFAHRSHRASGVQVCHIHGRALGRLRPEQHDELARHGLLIPTIEGSPAPWSMTELPLFGSHAFALKYARFAAAALSGRLLPSSIIARQAAYLDRLRSWSGGEKSPASTLARALRREASDEILAALRLHPSTGPSASWPALILEGPAHAQNPIANLLVISLLFADSDDFNHAISRHADHPPITAVRTRRTKWGFSRVGLSVQMIQDILREPSLVIIAQKHDVFFETIEDFLHFFPRLAARRPQALRRRRYRLARLAVRSLLKRQPNASRADLIKEAPTSYEWLRRYDGQWLDNMLPSTRSKPLPVTPYDSAFDSKIAGTTAQLLTILQTEGDGHLRRTWSRLTTLLEPQVKKDIRAGRLPIAKASLKSLVESATGHSNRCLARIADLLLQGDGVTARTWACDLLLAYPNDRRVIDQVLILIPYHKDRLEIVETADAFSAN